MRFNAVQSVQVKPDLDHPLAGLAGHTTHSTGDADETVAVCFDRIGDETGAVRTVSVGDLKTLG